MCGDNRFEQVRLSTFKTWPYPLRDPHILAKNGLFYLQKFDHVKCFNCHATFSDWETSDSLFNLHRAHSKDCVAAYDIHKSASNVRLGADPLIHPCDLGYDEVDF